MKRTQEEILERIGTVKHRDFFGTQQKNLINYLDFENAKSFLKEGITEEQWKECREKVVTPKEQMIGYMDFAFGKAWGERGLSAGRSIGHFSVWLWLDGNEELAKSIQDYTDYGKPQLREICEYLEIDPVVYGDGNE